MPGSAERPGDVVGMRFADVLRILAVDVTVVHIQSPNYVRLASRAPGHGTAAAEQRKRDQCGARCQAEGLQFVPFAVDEFGHIGDAGQALLQQLAAAKAASGRGDFREGRTVADRRAYLLRAWRSRVAWAVHEGMHESMQRRLRLARQPAGLGPGGVAL